MPGIECLHNFERMRFQWAAGFQLKIVKPPESQFQSLSRITEEETE